MFNMYNRYSQDAALPPDSNNVRILETHRRTSNYVINTYFKVTSQYLNRLDLISHLHYKTPLLAWAIADANDLINPFDIQIGMVLAIPDIQSITNNVNV